MKVNKISLDTYLKTAYDLLKKKVGMSQAEFKKLVKKI